MLLEAGDDDQFTSGQQTRVLYRACVRALRGVDEGTSADVLEHARGLIAANAHESDARRIRTLLVDGRHSLDEMVTCLGTSVVMPPVARAEPSAEPEGEAVGVAERVPPTGPATGARTSGGSGSGSSATRGVSGSRT